VEGSISGKLSGSVSATQVRDLWDETYLYDYSENATIPVQVSQERLPDYITANVALSYELTDSANAYLRIENALDRKYETIKGFSQPGRTLFVGVQSNF
jgi:vitamin B12 transporter